jgi:hypothetical protein
LTFIFKERCLSGPKEQFAKLYNRRFKSDSLLQK